MSSSLEPPRKKQKVSPSKYVVRDDEEEEEEDDNENDGYFYSLHVNPDIIIFSSDPCVACNINFDIESDLNAEPNLFLVKKGHINDSNYNVSEWLNYHEYKTNDIGDAALLLSNRSLSICIITGAGMGVDSNLPDYRSQGGFWNTYKALKDSSLSLYDMSKTDWFCNSPYTAWGFYAHRAKLYRDAIPHSGFNVLFNLCENGKRDYFYMTSNIDGQAIKAGFNENKLYQTHGALHYLQCLNFCKNSNIIPFYDEYNKFKIDLKTFKISNIDKIPICKYCNSLTRPNVSFFSDTNDTFNNERIIKQKQKFMKWLKKFDKTNKKLIVIEIGCGQSVHSLRWETQYLYSAKNINLIRINPTENLIMDSKKNLNSKPSHHIILKLPAKLALDTINKYIKK